MGFIMEFAENLILRMMEDPKKRDEAQRKYIYEMKERCEKAKANWNLPLVPYGFRTFDKFNVHMKRDAEISLDPGRRDPYDELLESPVHNPSSSSRK